MNGSFFNKMCQFATVLYRPVHAPQSHNLITCTVYAIAIVKEKSN